MKLFIATLLVAFSMSLPCTGEDFSAFKPRRDRNSIFSKFTSADQIEYHYGIVAGQNIATIKTPGTSSQDVITGWMVGAAMQVVWPQGLAVQPEILYSQKGCITEDRMQYGMDYIEVPVKIKYRLYLSDIKPFAFVSPYAAYAIRISPVGDASSDVSQISKFDAGIGAGAGFDIWNVQLSFKYSWGFTQVLNELSPIRNKVFTISIGYLF